MKYPLEVNNEEETDNAGKEINVLSYDLDFQIIPEKKLIRGSSKILIIANDNLTNFHLDFHNSYKIISLKVNNTITEYKYEKGNKLLITPGKPIKKNALFKVEVSYYNTKEIGELWDATIANSNFYFSGIPNYLLYPCNYDEGDRARYKIDVILPEDYRIASFEKPEYINKQHAVCISLTTSSPSNFTLNLLKNYSIFDIESKRGLGAISSKVTIRQYTPIDSTVIFNDLIKKIPNQISFLDSLIGGYPHKRFSVIITKNTQKNKVSHSRGTISVPYLYTLDSTEANVKILNGLVHQWFGDKISAKTSDDEWITEGLSTYFEWLWIEKNQGKEIFFNMVNAKHEETKKFMGISDWKNMNLNPMYKYDLHYVQQDFGKLSKNKLVTDDDLTLIFKVISLDTSKVSDKVSDSFEKEFGHKIDEYFKDGHSYYKIMQWAKSQDPGTFYISPEGFLTLKTIQQKEKRTYKYKLAKPGNNKYHYSVGVRGALFIQYLRLYFGDEEFFTKLKTFVVQFSGGPIETEDVINYLNKESEGELNTVIQEWLYSEDKLPSLPNNEK
ncbi:MAG: hypothetical protein ABFR62_08650 [Bacteroidota bacterium]